MRWEGKPRQRDLDIAAPRKDRYKYLSEKEKETTRNPMSKDGWS